MGVNSLPMTVTQQRRDCDLNPGPFCGSSMLTTRLPSHPDCDYLHLFNGCFRPTRVRLEMLGFSFSSSRRELLRMEVVQVLCIGYSSNCQCQSTERKAEC